MTQQLYSSTVIMYVLVFPLGDQIITGLTGVNMNFIFGDVVISAITNRM